MAVCRLLMVVVSGLALLSPQTLFGQINEFRNLDFEESLFDLNDPSSGSSDAEVLPGWSFSGSYNTSFVGPHISGLPQRYLGGVAGDYSVILEAGCSDEVCATGVEGVTIFQSGLVPGDTRSIRLWASDGPNPFEGVNAWNLSLGGFDLNLIEIGNGEWGADIPQSIAGQVRQLGISVDSDYEGPNFSFGFGFYPSVEFDDIRFSPAAISVPEPSAGFLLALSAVSVGLRRSRRASGSRRPSA